MPKTFRAVTYEPNAHDYKTPTYLYMYVHDRERGPSS